MYIENYSRRTKAAFLLFFILLILSSARLFYIQFKSSKYLASLAKKQQNFFMELEPRRGTIYDANLKPQAVNLACDSVYGSPNEIPEKEKEFIIKKLIPILNVEESYLKSRLSRNKSFIWLCRKITPQQAQAIKKLNFKGIGFIKESKRCYPNSYLASQIIGFAGLDNNGLEGLEMYYDSYLKGQAGWAVLLRDARSKKLDLYEKMMMPRDGYDLVLTIDEVIQYIAEKELDKAFRMYRAKAASIIVMDPKTGRILAMANRPDFDLEDRQTINIEKARNRAVCDLFEPGSVFKIVTASAALEEKKVTEQDRFFCENGKYQVANHILHDHRPHGWLTFKEVIEQSSNIGTCKVAQKLGLEVLYRYIKLFGFGTKTGIDLPGEISGIAKDSRGWSKTSISAIPMGQEVGVTALQLANAISVIANGGFLMKPYIVNQIRDKQGQTIKSFSPIVVRQVLSPETSARVKKILIGVLENGTGKLARLTDFTAGGKTGTGQKLEPNGSYSHDKFMASFIGFAPAEDPQLAVVVVIDEPRGNYFGGVVAAPVFKNVCSDALRYLKNRENTNDVMAFHEVYSAD